MAAQVEIEDQESGNKLGNGEIFDDSLSDNADSGLGSFSGDSSSTTLINEGSTEYNVFKNDFISGMGPLSSETTIVSLRKIDKERITTKARFVAFRVFMQAMKMKNNGEDANVTCGWYSGSKEEIDRIVTYGFSNREINKSENDANSHGVGIHLVHHSFSLAAALVGERDKEGIKHLLLCRVILGRPELIVAGSNQSYPSSSQFDSGVDNLQNPRKYVVWSSNMNSYILPVYIVSFRSPDHLTGLNGLGRARPPCVRFSVVMSILSKSLDAQKMKLILTTYDDFRKRKLRKDELVRKLREVVGDHLLHKILKNQTQVNSKRN